METSACCRVFARFISPIEKVSPFASDAQMRKRGWGHIVQARCMFPEAAKASIATAFAASLSLELAQAEAAGARGEDHLEAADISRQDEELVDLRARAAAPDSALAALFEEESAAGADPIDEDNPVFHDDVTVLPVAVACAAAYTEVSAEAKAGQERELTAAANAEENSDEQGPEVEFAEGG